MYQTVFHCNVALNCFQDDGVLVNGDKLRSLGAPSYWDRMMRTNAKTKGRWVISMGKSDYCYKLFNINIDAFCNYFFLFYAGSW